MQIDNDLLKNMRIEKNHKLGTTVAIQKLNSYLDDLLHQPLRSGVVIKDPSRIWTGSAMDFSFRAKKGLLGATIKGKVEVNDQQVVLETELPGLIRTFVSEDTIRQAIDQQLGKVLG